MNPQLHNNACQIHKSCYGTPSSITMGLQWSLLQYWPCNATRQFFNFRCMQSIESNIPVNPYVSLICSRRLMSLLFGLPKYISHNISFTSLTKASKHWIPVHSVILTYSLTLSTSDLYANIWIVVVHFCNGEKSFSTSCIKSHLKIQIMIIDSDYNLNEQLLLHPKPSSKLPLCVYRIFKEVFIQRATMSAFTITIYMASWSTFILYL